MEFLPKFIKSRVTPIPKILFKYIKELNIDIKELDLILKILNFNIGGNDLYPKLGVIAEKSTTSLRTFQRLLDSLKNKNVIETTNRRDESGKFSSSIYDFSGLYEKIEQLENNDIQLSFEFLKDDCNYYSFFNRFGKFSKILFKNGYIASPRALDNFEKELDLNSYENVFIKFCLGLSDENGKFNLSLNSCSKYLPISRNKLAAIISSLNKKGLIEIEAQYKKSNKRLSNRYNLMPLLEKLEELEKKKVQEILENRGEWKNYEREHQSIQEVQSKQVKQKQNQEQTTPQIQKQKQNSPFGEKAEDQEAKIANIKLQITDLQKQYISKNSEKAEEIRLLERELSSIMGGKKDGDSLKNLLFARMQQIKKKDNYISEDEAKAKEVCERLGGNWNKNKNFYLKSVRVLKGTIDRFVGSTVELASNKERYFLSMVSKEFTKITS